MHERIRAMIEGGSVCVLATVAEGVPHCSLMSYVTDAAGREFYMLTLAGTRKYRNLSGNRAVSLLIDNRGTAGPGGIQALTVSGRVREIDEPGEAESVRRRLLARHPALAELTAGGETRLIAVRATALQLLDGVSRAQVEILE